MRFTVQKYDPVSSKADDLGEPIRDEIMDENVFDVNELGLADDNMSIKIEDQTIIKRNLQPVVRFSDLNDESIQSHGVVSEELSTLLRNDSYISENMGNFDSTATVRPTADRKTGAVVDHIARRGRLFAKRHQSRLVFKDGTCNVATKNIFQRKQRYLVDIFTTFIDMKWRYNIFLFGVAFIGSWFAFALIWWAIAVYHQDYRAINETDWPSCVANVYDFPTALLFSVETQHTIGYGTRAMETNCPVAVIVLMLQSCYGVFIQSLMTGLLFAKLSRPKRRARTIMFSKRAVICMRDNQYCLLFRLGDMRRSHIIGTSIRALLVKNRLTREGESIPLCQYSLTVETETNFGDNFVFLVWPVTVVHRIVEGSPLWDLSAKELLAERFEIIVIFEGIVENTGMMTQFRTSYLPSEILWGHHLEPLVTYCKANGQYDIDFRRFHQTRPVESMHECSAREHTERFGVPLKASERYRQDRDYLANFTAATDNVKTKKYTAKKNLGFRRKLGKNSRVFGMKSVPEQKAFPLLDLPACTTENRGSTADAKLNSKVNNVNGGKHAAE